MHTELPTVTVEELTANTFAATPLTTIWSPLSRSKAGPLAQVKVFPVASVLTVAGAEPEQAVKFAFLCVPLLEARVMDVFEFTEPIVEQDAPRQNAEPGTSPVKSCPLPATSPAYVTAVPVLEARPERFTRFALAFPISMAGAGPVFPVTGFPCRSMTTP